MSMFTSSPTPTFHPLCPITQFKWHDKKKKIVTMLSTHDSGETKIAPHTEKETDKLVRVIRHNRNMSKAGFKDHLLLMCLIHRQRMCQKYLKNVIRLLRHCLAVYHHIWWYLAPLC